MSGGVVGRECSSSSSVVKRTPLLSVAGVADVDRTLEAALEPLAVVGRVVEDALGVNRTFTGYDGYFTGS